MENKLAPMDKDTQLPAERFNRGDYVAGEDIIILVTAWGYDENRFSGVVVETLPDAQFPKRLGEHSNTWYTRYFKKIEYATKLLREQQAIEEKIYKALHAERNKQQKRFTESETAWAGKVIEARTLLEKVIYRHEGGLLPDRLLYNEIKTFLDGAK